MDSVVLLKLKSLWREFFNIYIPCLRLFNLKTKIIIKNCDLIILMSRLKELTEDKRRRIERIKNMNLSLTEKDFPD